MKFSIIVSDFNSEITHELLQGATSRLMELGISSNHISTIHVPGAVEIPLIAQRLAKTKKSDIIICLGAVIRGDTDHYDYVCQQVSQGCQHVMMQYDIPIIFGILTTQTLQQAKDRIGGKEGHKGKDAADAAIQMMTVLNNL